MFYLKIALTIQGLLWFHTHLGLFIVAVGKDAVGVWVETVLNIWVPVY